MCFVMLPRFFLSPAHLSVPRGPTGAGWDSALMFCIVTTAQKLEAMSFPSEELIANYTAKLLRV